MPTNITAVLLGRLGDLIVATPLLRALRESEPGARIRLVVNPSGLEAAGLIPFVDEAAAPGLGLLRAPCDLLVDLNPSFSRSSTALCALLRAKRKVSFRRGRWDGVFTEQIQGPGEDEPMLDRYARLADALGASSRYRPQTELRLPPPGERPAGRRVLIHPGNFKKFDNRWPEEKFAALAELLAADGLAPCWLAGPGERDRVAEIAARLKDPGPVIGPLPLAETAALLKAMDLCVLNITGTTHLAGAAGAPTFGLYSGYTHAVWRLRGPQHAGAVSASWESCRDIAVAAAYRGVLAHLKELKKL